LLRYQFHRATIRGTPVSGAAAMPATHPPFSRSSNTTVRTVRPSRPATPATPTTSTTVRHARPGLFRPAIPVIITIGAPDCAESAEISFADAPFSSHRFPGPGRYVAVRATP